jgi:hypothetical protein
MLACERPAFYVSEVIGGKAAINFGSGVRHVLILGCRYFEQEDKKGKRKIEWVSLTMSLGLPASPIETLQGFQDGILRGIEGGFADG